MQPDLNTRAAGRKRALHGRFGVIVIASTTGVTLGTGVAYAAWTSSGTGAGAGKATTFQAITISAGTAPAGQLYPGLTANGTTLGGDLVVITTNPNPFPVTATLTQTATSGCTTTGVTLTSGTTVTLAANTANVTQTLSKVLSMSTASSDNCQGATISVSFSSASVSS